MKKLALAISLGAYIAFSASASALAALRIDNAAGVASIRDSRVAWSVTGTNARLLFLNEALYPETTSAVTSSLSAHGDQERADMAQPYTTSSVTGTNARLLFVNEALYPETTIAVTSSLSAHGDQERADMAQNSTTSTETQRMFCEGDICIVP